KRELSRVCSKNRGGATEVETNTTVEFACDREKPAIRGCGRSQWQVWPTRRLPAANAPEKMKERQLVLYPSAGANGVACAPPKRTACGRSHVFRVSGTARPANLGRQMTRGCNVM